MKRVGVFSFIVLLFVFCINTSIYAQECNEYDWVMRWYSDSASSVWRICPDKIEFEITCITSEFFLASNAIMIVQSGNQYQTNPYSSSNYEFLITFDNCGYIGNIKQGVTCTGRLSDFPSSFDVFNPFRIYYDVSYADVDGAPIPTTTSTTSSIYEGICPTEVIYGEDSEPTEMLRCFRDKVLSRSPEGRAIIKLYYLWSPVISNAIKGDEQFKEDIRQTVDTFLPMIETDVLLQSRADK